MKITVTKVFGFFVNLKVAIEYLFPEWFVCVENCLALI